MLLVGAGGNGSIMLTHLCRIATSFAKLGGVPIQITIMDDDTVSESNLGRQCFSEADVGQPKAIVLAQRARAFFGLPVEAKVERMNNQSLINHHPDIVVGCVDTLQPRKNMNAYVKRIEQEHGDHGRLVRNGYWLDLGNTADSGQVVLGGYGLPTVFDVLPQMKTMKEPKNLPSCSLAEALSKQDLFINSTLASFGAQILWRLLRQGQIQHHGYFINLNAGVVRPIACPTQY